jgi:hypothetical protein
MPDVALHRLVVSSEVHQAVSAKAAAEGRTLQEVVAALLGDYAKGKQARPRARRPAK